MRKIVNFCIILVLCFCVTGCGNVTLDLDKLSDKLDTLAEDTFDISSVVENVEYKDNLLGELLDVYDYELEDLKINRDNISNMVFRVDENKKPVYIVIEYVDGKKDDVKKDINNYINSLSDLKEKYETEYENHLIYIFSDKKDEILKRIKDSKRPVFGMLMEVDDEYLETLTGIKPENLDEYLVKNSIITRADSYFILKPKKGKKEEVKKELKKYMENLEKQWETYLPDQYELVKNRLEEEYGQYLIYVISSNNDLVLKTIKGYRK